jgi:hypothetical protein
MHPKVKKTRSGLHVKMISPRICHLIKMNFLSEIMKLLLLLNVLGLSFVSYAQDSVGEAEPDARILSIYHGLTDITPYATQLLCDLPPARDQDGIPVVFSVQVNSETITPTAFAVGLSSGETVTPLCATLRPAVESLEQRTVLLIGAFSPDDAVPVSVEIVEQLEDANGFSLLGLKSENVTTLSAGPSLVFAERFNPNNSGLDDECPKKTEQAILLTWEGGVTGANGADLAEEQRTAVFVVLQDGTSVNPLSLADDDFGQTDNHIIACIGQKSAAVSVSVIAGYFHDPGDDANPETRINISSAD